MNTYNTVAAKWWADQIRANRKEANKKTPKKCYINEFEELLASTILEIVDKDNSMSLSCEYSPVGVLHDIATKCRLGSDLDLFPSKVKMNISKSKIAVKAGYGEHFETIFADN